MIPHTLTIAGSDSGGGAGIQADLKTFSALGAYGCSVITALTAQNTLGVHGIHAIPADFIAAQLSAVLDDIRIDAVKIGMLADADVIAAVADGLQQRTLPCIVLDPVMIAKGGQALLQQEAIAALRTRLLPLASLVTPNLPEAAALLNCAVARTDEEMVWQGQALLQAGCQRVLMKGGHRDDADATDWLVTPQGVHAFRAGRLATRNTHGTGCTLSAALAALYPRHDDWVATIQAAKDWLTEALRHADELNIGHGIGPVHHFHALWPALCRT